jgi:beta-glucosidase
LELKGFRRVHIEAGQTADVKMELQARDLAYWDEKAHTWQVEKEKVRLLAGGSSDNPPVQATVEIEDSSTLTPIQMRELATKARMENH